jgi:hypothetical protein
MAYIQYNLTIHFLPESEKIPPPLKVPLSSCFFTEIINFDSEKTYENSENLTLIAGGSYSYHWAFNDE